MEYEHLFHDFARRTRHNLALIRQARAEGREAYEVTQLINSMLGLLVLPRERYLQSIPAVPLEQLRRDGWPEPVLVGGFDQVKDLRGLIHALRHSIAHFNIEFTETGGEITGVRLTNRHQGRVRWRATLGLAELESIADRFTALILQEGEGGEAEREKRRGGAAGAGGV